VIKKLYLERLTPVREVGTSRHHHHLTGTRPTINNYCLLLKDLIHWILSTMVHIYQL